MRPIDADSISYTMLYKENWMKGTGKEAQGAWKSDIDKMPTIDAVPVKHGEWTIINGCVSCSVCGEPNMEWNYCPNCGAKMDGGKDDA